MTSKGLHPLALDTGLGVDKRWVARWVRGSRQVDHWVHPGAGRLPECWGPPHLPPCNTPQAPYRGQPGQLPPHPRERAVAAHSGAEAGLGERGWEPFQGMQDTMWIKVPNSGAAPLAHWISLPKHKLKHKVSKNFKMRELPWWSSGWDSTLLMCRARVRSLVRELDPTCCN